MTMHGGHLIREARRRAGLTQAELAERISTAQPNVARWESADMSPSVDMLTQVVRACGLDLLVRLVPREASDWEKVEDSREVSLDERLEKLVGFVDVIEDGAEAKQTRAKQTRAKKTLKSS
jgi:transcriptional regulator with XRE-family HTH domain